MKDLNPLAIKSIRLRGKGGEFGKQPDRPASMKRAGNVLLEMLRVEYNEKDSPIAGLQLADAVDTLKDQIDKYTKGYPPFDKPLGRDDDPFKWWVQLDEDTSLVDDDGFPEVQPLAVGPLQDLNAKRT